MVTTGAEMLFVAKCLAWRMEQPEVRTVSISFAHYGLYAYLYGKHNSCASCWASRETGEYSFEEAVKEIEREEREAECQTEETCEDQKSTTSYDAEKNGITVGTSS